ncbi:fluoride efflux transporter CrcB [Helicobacter pylori]|nr:fluoride efflux transporter CrcB [Helicobacter pylori]
MHEFCLFMGRFRGAIGSSLRYFVGKMMPSKFLMFESFPLGTFSVNIIGCFVIGFMGHLAVKKVFGDDFGIFFVTGVLGGFTTFSSYGLDTLKLLQKSQYIEAVSYALGTNILGLTGVAIGWFLAKNFVGIH